MKKKPLFLKWVDCIELDLCASTVLSLILMNINSLAKKEKIDICTQGVISDTNEVNILLLKNGFFKYQGYGKDAPVLEEVENMNDKIEILQLVAGGQTDLEFRGIETISKEIKFDYFFDCGSHITNFFDNCIQKSNCFLNDNGKNAVNKLVGEILTNLKEHLGKRFSQYFIIGFFKKNGDVGEANLAFINFGDTFYEGLKENSTEDMLELLNQYTHIYKRLNGDFTEEFTEEMFWTQLALQTSISRKYEKDSFDIRGTGTVSLIDSFFDLKNSSNDFVPKFCLISGNTKIQFDINDKSYYNEGILIFNENKNIFEKQNNDKIMNLSEFFPGAIISLDFTLKSSWIEEEEKWKS